MKTKTLRSLIAIAIVIGAVASCKQDVITLKQPTTPTVEPVTPSKGNADFTKFVAIGNSLAAGYQASALFDSGQVNSFPAMMAKQFKLVGGGAFNQPTINSKNGYSGNIGGVVILGRYILFDPDGTGPRTAAPYPAGYPGSSVTCPSAVTTPALPSPYNTADLIGAFTGDKSALNNFGVPGIQLGQLLTPATGGPATSNPAYNPFYARFASNPSVNGTSGSTILGDAITAAPSFFLLEIGNNDVLGYATTGGNGSIAITASGTFSAYYDNAINALLGSNSNLKGVIATIPNVTNIPYFFTVTWNAVTLDAATAASVTTNLANNYNAFLDGMVGATVITAAEAASRKLTYVAGKNGALIDDKTLTDLSPYMTGPYAGLAPYKIARQATATDLLTLPSGGVLGTCFGGNSSAVIGVSYPLDDKYVLLPSETTNILTATAAYNTKIQSIVAANPTRLALADVNKAFADLVAAKIMASNGVFISPTLTPPTGAFSEDGVHPNTRGYAFLANIYLTAINTTFSANIPLVDISKYSGTGLPVNP